MRYAYHDLGHQDEGNTIVVRWRGSGADVMLLDRVNFIRYREQKHPLFYSGGGRYGSPPAELRIPEDGQWYVVADLRGNSAYAKVTVEVLSAEGTQQMSEEEPLVEVA